jgi:hypothetical protein
MCVHPPRPGFRRAGLGRCGTLSAERNPENPPASAGHQGKSSGFFFTRGPKSVGYAKTVCLPSQPNRHMRRAHRPDNGRLLPQCPRCEAAKTWRPPQPLSTLPRTFLTLRAVDVRWSLVLAQPVESPRSGQQCREPCTVRVHQPSIVGLGRRAYPPRGKGPLVRFRNRLGYNSSLGWGFAAPPGKQAAI